MPEQCCLNERERAKQIIKDVLNQEINLKRIDSSRFGHIERQIIFKIDNPDYIRQKDRVIA